MRLHRHRSGLERTESFNLKKELAADSESPVATIENLAGSVTANSVAKVVENIETTNILSKYLRVARLVL